MQNYKTFLVFIGLLSTISVTSAGCSNNPTPVAASPIVASPTNISEQPKPVPSSKEQLLGTWTAQVECTKEDGIIKGNIETKYFANDASNSSGEISLVVKDEKKEEVEFSFSLEGSGEWTVKDKTVIEKLVDVHIMPKSFKKGALQIDLTKTEDPTVQEILQEPSFKLMTSEFNKSFIKGKSSESNLTKIDDDRIKLEDQDETDDCLKVTNYKRKPKQ